MKSPKMNLGALKRRVSAETKRRTSAESKTRTLGNKNSNAHVRSPSRSRKGNRPDLSALKKRLKQTPNMSLDLRKLQLPKRISFDSKDSSIILNINSTTDDVLEWLSQNNLEEYKQIFEDEEFDGGSFILLDQSNMKEMGIKDDAQRKILQGIERTKMNKPNITETKSDIPMQKLEIFFDPKQPMGIGYEGIQIGRVQPGSQAAKGGVYAGCKIISINGHMQVDETKKIEQTINSAKQTGTRFKVIFAKPRKSVAISTNFGYNCDSMIALSVALADHIAGRICIKYLTTCSGNTVKRAKLLQWMCGLYGIIDIPIIPGKCHVDTADEKDNIVELWKYSLSFDEDSQEVFKKSDLVKVEHWFPPNHPLCPIIDVKNSIKDRIDILNRSEDVHLLFIGPDPDVNVLYEISDPKKSIAKLTWLGNYDFESNGSLSMAEDKKLYIERKDWCNSHQIPSYYMGPKTGNHTCLSSKEFSRLQKETPNFDLRLFFQLGAKEFRDGNRELFYQINPPPAGKQSIKDLDSECSEWFDVLRKLNPMLALTAYIFFRDVQGTEHDLYKVSDDNGEFSVGIKLHDLKPSSRDYMAIIVDKEICPAIKQIEFGKYPEMTPESSTPQIAPEQPVIETKKNFLDYSNEGVSVSKWLTNLGLEHYCEVFDEERYDDLDQIKQFSKEELTRMTNNTKMKKGAAAKIHLYFRKKKEATK